MPLTKLSSVNLLTTDSYTFGNANVTGNVTANAIRTNNLLYANGSPWSVGGGGSGNTITNGNSNVSIPTGNGNINLSVAGNANIVTVTGTGVNIAGTGNFTGNITGSNLTLTGILTSNIATGTAPLTVTSTTRVANLNVAQSNVSDFISVTTQTSGNAFIVLANAVTGNVAETANAVFVANSSNGAIHATTFVGALSGAATTAGTVTTNAQPNITSVGILSNLTSNGTINFTGASNVSLGAIANVKITGGTSGQYITTDGTGNLSFATVSAGGGTSISNGNSNVNIPAANGNVSIGVAGNANIALITGTGVNVAGTLNVTGNANVGNLGATNVVASTLTSNVATGTAPLTVTSTTRVSNLNVDRANLADFINITTQTSDNAFIVLANAVTGNIAESANSVFVANSSNGAIHATTFVGALSGAATTAGTVTTNAQPNITSLGTLANLTSNGTINFTGASNVSLGAAANIKVTGGSNGQVLTTDGTGNLSWTTVSAGSNSTIAIDNFTGDNTTTTFTLSVTPLSKDYTLINIDGVSQLHNAYSLTGNAITLSGAPATGAEVEVISFMLGSGGSSGGSSGPSAARVTGYNLVFGL